MKLLCKWIGHNWITSLEGCYNSWCRRCGHIATVEEGARRDDY